jgi:hypothetical protein
VSRGTCPAGCLSYAEAIFGDYKPASIYEAFSVPGLRAFWPRHSELSILLDLCFFSISASEIAGNVHRITIPAMYGQQQFAFFVDDVQRAPVRPCLVSIFAGNQVKLVAVDPRDQLVFIIVNIGAEEEPSILELCKHERASPDCQ